MSAKQDRQGVRTARDLEQKYRFGQSFNDAKNSIRLANQTASQAESTAKKAGEDVIQLKEYVDTADAAVKKYANDADAVIKKYVDTTASQTKEYADTADEAVKGYVDGKFLGRMRLLTSADDCNNIKDDGVYWYSTNSVPKNAPFPNAAIMEVYGADNTTSQKIQRATRYGAGGYSATRALYDSNWCEWYHYALTTDGVIPISMGGTGGTSVATAQAALQVNQDFLFSQLNSSGNKTSDGINAYPTKPGVYRVTTGSSNFGVPGDYGCLVIFAGGGYYMHLYVNADAFWTARTTSMTAPTWKKMAVAT